MNKYKSDDYKLGAVKYCSKMYDCKNCELKIDRDINASKNILMKGIMCVST